MSAPIGVSAFASVAILSAGAVLWLVVLVSVICLTIVALSWRHGLPPRLAWGTFSLSFERGTRDGD